MSNLFNQTISLKKILTDLKVSDFSGNDINMKAISDSDSAVPFSFCDYIKGPLPEQVEGLVLLVKEPIDNYLCIVVSSPQQVLIEIIKYIHSSVGFVQKYSNSSIPSSVKIGKNVVIEDNVEIGEGTVIEHNAVIHSGTKIGRNCLIRTHASIGGDGYGFIKLNNGDLIKQPHLGGVELADNVEIGSNTCIVRGIVNDTYLGRNVKVDNLVHIAHDCYVDDDAFIIASSELSGYVKVGKRSRIAPKACVKQRICIGDDAVVGMGAVVIKNVNDKEVIVGNPGRPLG